MRRIIDIFKNSLHIICAIVMVLVVTIYLATHFNLNGYLAKNLLTGDLANYLGTEVNLDNAEVDIFNQIVLDNLLVKDREADTLLYARRAMISFDLMQIFRKRLQIHTIQLVDFDIHLTRQDSLSETNFQFLVDIFLPKDKDNRRKVLDDINVNSILFRSGKLSFDDYSEKKKATFDPKHLSFNDISANLKILSSKEKGLYLRLKRLSLEESSGTNILRASTTIELDEGGKRLDFNDIYLSVRQKIDYNHTANVELRGFAAMENKKLNAQIVSLQTKIPGILDLETKAKGEDVLSLKENMTFALDITKLNITAQGLTFFTNKYKRLWQNNIAPYISEIQDISIKTHAEGSAKEFRYNAEIECFGELTSDISLEGKYSDEENLNCNIIASARNVNLRKHSYDEILINGTLTNEYFDGNISINDPNCTLDAKGKIIYPKKKIYGEMKINNIEPYKLNITDIKHLEGVTFAGKISSDLNLANVKRPLGKIAIDSLYISRDKLLHLIPSIEFESRQENDNYFANILSEIVNIHFLSNADSENISGRLNDSKVLSEIFRIPVSVSKTASADLLLDKDNNIVRSEISLPEVLYDGAMVELQLKSKNIADSLKHNLHIDYRKNGKHLSSDLRGTTHYNTMYADIEPCTILFNNDIIDCGGATFERTANNHYNIKHFNLKHKEQVIDVKGIVSKEGNSNLAIHIENLGIDSLCSFLSSNYLKFGGIGTGDILFTKDSTNNLKTDNLFIKDFSYLGGLLGDARLDASFNLDRKRLDVEAEILSKEDSLSRISGYVQIATKDSLDLTIDAKKFNIEFLKYWVGGFLEDFHGDLTGNVRLYGLARELKLVGKPFADVSFTNHLSGSQFFLKDYITLTKDAYSEDGYFLMNNAKIYDRFDHEAHATATIKHRYLRKYNYDVRIDFPNDNAGFLAFDKPTHYNNELYWGQLYANGSVLLRGGDGKHKIDVSCRTAGKSYFNLSPGEENYSDNGYSFLSFRDKKAFVESENGVYSENRLVYPINEGNNSTYIEFDIQAEATEHCQVYVQMDPLAEDRLLCRGTGDISLHYDPQHDITIGGVYNITQGNYLVTMRGDLINKEFKIQNGSRVLFPGNFSGAELNINAVYSIPSVNLRDLDESFATLASINRTTLPVDCKLAVTGQLNAPQITFDLEVKNTSDDVQALVHNLIGTPEMLNREIFYLLLFSKFYTPEYASTSQNNSGSELSSFTSASLTSQLNNLLGHLSDNFTLGTNFRSDKGDFSDMEMDVSLSTRLLGDRLILNGNLGYRDPANRVGLNNNNSFIGDFDVEYLINPNGTLRAKAYSHYNERDYSINNALTTQGIGFVVRRDFKSIKELLFWKKIKEKKYILEK